MNFDAKQPTRWLRAHRAALIAVITVVVIATAALGAEIVDVIDDAGLDADQSVGSTGMGEAAESVPVELARGNYVVYFYDPDEDEYERESYRPVVVEGNSNSPKRRLLGAIGSLLEGRNAETKAQGLISAFNRRTEGMLNGVMLKHGEARINFVDFSDLLPNSGTSSGSTIMLNQIFATVFAVEDVDSVELQFGGSCKAFWGWLGGSCKIVDRATWDAGA